MVLVFCPVVPRCRNEQRHPAQLAGFTVIALNLLVAPQPELRREGSLIFLSGVGLTDLLGSLKACECHASLGIEAMIVRGAPSLEFLRACIRFDYDSALVDDTVMHLTRTLLPFGEGAGHDAGIFEDRQEVLVLSGASEPQHTNRTDSHRFHLNLLVAALGKSFAAYQQGSDFSCRSCLDAGLPVCASHESLNRADTNAIGLCSNNVQARADRAVEFPHAESFASCGSDSSNPIKRKRDAASGPLTQSQGKNPKMERCQTTITGEDYLTLLRPWLREYCHSLRGGRKNGRPSAGPVQRLPMVGFCLPNEKDPGMSQLTPPKFFLSG